MGGEQNRGNQENYVRNVEFEKQDYFLKKKYLARFSSVDLEFVEKL